MKSKCCQTEMATNYGEEGTNCFICSECNKACDIYQEVWKHLFDETRLMKEGGSFLECSDYEGICKDMYEFVEFVIKDEKIKMLDGMIKDIEKQNVGNLNQSGMLVIQAILNYLQTHKSKLNL